MGSLFLNCHLGGDFCPGGLCQREFCPGFSTGEFCPTVAGSSMWIFSIVLSSSLLGHVLHHYIIQLYSYWCWFDLYCTTIPLLRILLYNYTVIGSFLLYNTVTRSSVVQ